MGFGAQERVDLLAVDVGAPAGAVYAGGGELHEDVPDGGWVEDVGVQECGVGHVPQYP